MKSTIKCDLADVIIRTRLKSDTDKTMLYCGRKNEEPEPEIQITQATRGIELYNDITSGKSSEDWKEHQ
jgi:hypothetical protein